ncbi:MAG TPA: hypothetical protein VIK89_15205 [Cytophagaceae bacterium]
MIHFRNIFLILAVSMLVLILLTWALGKAISVLISIISLVAVVALILYFILAMRRSR